MYCSQVLALLAYLIDTRSVCRPFLIAAPAAVVSGWEKEVAAWLPQLTVIPYRGPAANRIALFETIVSFLGDEPTFITVSSCMVHRNISLFLD